MPLTASRFVPSTTGRPRRWRRRFGPRFDVLWLVNAHPRFTVPVPPTRNFLYAVRFVFIFGIKLPFLYETPRLFRERYPTQNASITERIPLKKLVTVTDTKSLLVGTNRVELLTSCLSSKRSNQLSYAPPKWSMISNKYG
jgi:hypothetical protein